LRAVEVDGLNAGCCRGGYARGQCCSLGIPVPAKVEAHRLRNLEGIGFGGKADVTALAFEVGIQFHPALVEGGIQVFKRFRARGTGGWRKLVWGTEVCAGSWLAGIFVGW